VINAARQALGRREQDWREFLKQLEADRLKVLEESEALEARRIALDKDCRILADREEQLRAKQEKFLRTSEEKLDRVLEFVDTESRRLVKELKAHQKQASTLNADHIGMESRERVKTITQIAHSELKSVTPAKRPVQSNLVVREGGYARHRGLGVEGLVITIQNDRATIKTHQGRKLEARVGELDPIVRSEMETPARGSVRFKTDTSHLDSELNLIGRASDEVEVEVQRFVEEAISFGARFIRIVHGHGTGKLKAAVRAALRGHPSIAQVEDAPQAQGGAGATLISLR
jgi:DNA mismatch repair protein MutS2